MKLTNKKLRVVHIPQVPMAGFVVEVNNEREACLIYETLINQHLFLFDHHVIPEYANMVYVEMMERNGEWVNYFNDHELLDWDGFIEEYEDYVNGEEMDLLRNN